MSRPHKASRPGGPIGVLVMAYGGPDSLEDIPGYLTSVLGGRPTRPAVLQRVVAKYRLIGGCSPLLDISTRQAEMISGELNPVGEPVRFKCYLGMRHWAPWIEETVRQMLDDGIQRAVSLVMAPHYSRLSVAQYQKKIAAGLELHHGQIEFAHIDNYHTAAGYVQALAGRVCQGWSQWTVAERAQAHVLMTAHSLPARILSTGDPYDQQVRETAQLVAKEADLPAGQWSLAYQSASRSPEPWLGPDLEDRLVQLAAGGVRKLICLPIGFVADHVETLYDLDVQAQKLAQAQGMQLVRPAGLNDDPQFIGALAGLIREKAMNWVPKN